MTTLMLENLPTLPDLVLYGCKLLVRLGRKIDAIVGAKALRIVPEWRMRKVQSEINSHTALIRAARERGAV